MKHHNSIPWFAIGVAVVTLLSTACSRTTPVRDGDDTSRYIDYLAAARHFPGMTSTEVQKQLGSPNEVERKDNTRVLWHYRDRFWEADARSVYNQVTLVFDDKKCVAVEPQ